MGKLGIKSDNYTSCYLISMFEETFRRLYLFFYIKNVDCRLLRYLKQLLILTPYFPTMQALAQIIEKEMALPTLFFLLNFFKVLFSVVVIPSEQKHLTNLSLAFTNTCYSWVIVVLRSM